MYPLKRWLPWVLVKGVCATIGENLKDSDCMNSTSWSHCDDNEDTNSWDLLCALHGDHPFKYTIIKFFFTISLNFKQKAYKSGPQHFWHQGPVSWKTIFLWTRVLAGWFQDASSPLHSLCTLLLLLLYQLHLRSSGIRSWRLGTPIFITR